MGEVIKSVDETKLPSWLAGVANPISRFIDRAQLTNELETLSDPVLQDMGLCRDSIPDFVSAVVATIDRECCKMICNRRVDM